MAIHLATCLHLSCIYGEEEAGAVRCGSVWTLPRPPCSPWSSKGPLMSWCDAIQCSRHAWPCCQLMAEEILLS